MNGPVERGDGMPVIEGSHKAALRESVKHILGQRDRLRTTVAATLVALDVDLPVKPEDALDLILGRIEQLVAENERLSAEVARAEPVLVAADRVREAYDAMTDGRVVGRLPEWVLPDA